VLALLLFSPFRGLFFTSPVLLAAVAGLAVLWNARKSRGIAVVVGSVFAFLLLVNSSFNGWDGGWIAVPRYLAPAMALLAIPLAVAFERWRVATVALAAVSAALQLLIVAVDPQYPVGDLGHTNTPVAKIFPINPLTRYELPLLATGRAWPMLEESIEASVARRVEQSTRAGESRDVAQRKGVELRASLRERVERGDPSPYALAAVAGPVSANPIGMYEGAYFQISPAGSDEAFGNSFNLGEAVFARSAASLVVLLAIGSALFALYWRVPE
jgi:hypothetical protein